MTDCIVKWDGGSQTIKGASLGDPRVAELLDRLAKNGAKHPSLEFVDDFLDMTCSEFVTDPKSRYCLDCGYPKSEHRRSSSAGAPTK